MSTGSHEHSPVDLMVEEFLDRRQRGESVTVEEYCRRHPELEDEIRDVFEAVLMVEDLKPGTEDDSGTFGSGILMDGNRIERVGDYRILREIGRGGMGVVYEAEQESLGRRVALKVLSQQLSDGPKALERFQREARAAARMHHTNIVPVFDVGKDDQHLFYAMQLIQGQGLDQVIDELERLRSEYKSSAGDGRQGGAPSGNRDDAKGIAASLMSGHFHPENFASGDRSSSSDPGIGRKESDDAGGERSVAATITLAMQGSSTSSAVLPGKSDISTAESNHRAYFLSVAQIGLQTASALSYAHARGIIHRDIKPANLILDAAGIVWVTDFGLAKTGDQGMTHTGDILGTIRYMSPERFRGQCDVRADVYALGLTLYELLILKPAFASSDRLKLIELVSKTEPLAPRAVDPRIPRDLETIVLKAIDKEPRRRYQSADEMADDLQRVVNDEPILARCISIVERAARWSRRNPRLAAASSLAVIGLVAVAVLSTLFAREQNRLNRDLRTANTEQSRLNGVLTEVNVEQQRLYEELAKTSEERGQMITRLRTGQSRLALKQAEYDLEQGNLGEGFLWLARSYELAPQNDAALRDELLAHLSTTAEQIPRLRTSVPLDVRSRNSIAGTRPFARTANGTRGGTRTGAAGRGRGGFSGQGTLAAFSQNRRFLTVVDSSQQTADDQQQPTRQIRLWDTAEQEFAGQAIEVSRPGRLNSALSPDNRFLATIRSTRSRPGESASSRMAETLEIELTVSSVDTGEAVFGPIPIQPAGVPSFRIATPAICFSRNGSKVLVTLGYPERSGSLQRYRFDVLSWAADTGTPLDGCTIKMEREIPIGIDATFSRDGTQLLVNRRRVGGLFQLHQSGWVRVFDVKTGEAIGNQADFDGAVTQCLPLSPNGHRFAVVISRRNGRDNRVEVWDLDEERPFGSTIEITGGRTARILGADENGSRLVIASGQVQLGMSGARADAARTTRRGQVRVWDVATGEPLTPPIFTSGPALAATFMANGTSFLVRDVDSVRTWELPSPRLQRVLLPNEGPSSRLPRQLLAASGMRILGSAPFTDAGGDLEFGERDDLYMARPLDDSIRVTRWDVTSGQILDAVTVPGMDGPGAVRFGPGARVLSTFQYTRNSGSEPQVETTLQCWRTDNGVPIGQPIGHDRVLLPLAVSPGGEMIAAVEQNARVPQNGESPMSENGELCIRTGPPRLKVWETTTGTAVDSPASARLPLVADFARFLDRTTLLFGTRLLIRVWDVETGTVRPLSSRDPLETAEIAGRPDSEWVLGPGGRLVADFTDGFTLRVWDRRTGRALGLPLDHQQAITAVSFDPRGQNVATASVDGLVRQWSLPRDWNGSPAETMAQVEALVGMTLDEQGNFGILDPDAQSRQLRELGVWQDNDSSGGALSYSQRAALLEFDSGNWVEATAKLDRWIADQPRQWMPQVLRIRALAEQQRFDDARQSVEQAVQLVDAQTVTYWLQRFLRASQGDQFNRLVQKRLGQVAGESGLRIQEWYLEQLLDVGPPSVRVSDWLVQRAEYHEAQGQLKDAIAVMSEAIARQPDKKELFAKRARQYEKLLEWKLATEDHRVAVQADPADHFGRYRLGAMLLYDGDVQAYRQLCRELLEAWGDSEEPRVKERTAKLCLMLPTEGADLERACTMVDSAYENMATGLNRNFDVLSKALADYRRERFDDVIKTAPEAIEAFDERGNNLAINSALGDLVRAMALQKQGDRKLARQKYADAIDRIRFVYASYIEKGRLVPHDWMFAEIVRREAESVLDVRAEELDLPLPDTRDWKVILSDDFDRDEFGGLWTVVHGDWALEDGALRGTAVRQQTRPRATIRILNTEMPEYLEVEYDTWWPTGAISEVKLSDVEERQHYVAGLCGSPHDVLVRAGGKGTGPHMLSTRAGQRSAMYWLAKAPEVELHAGQRYHVRVLRLPNRLTMFVDGKEMLSEVVPTVDARTLQFYGSGPEGAVVYFDNLAVRVPEDDSSR